MHARSRLDFELSISQRRLSGLEEGNHVIVADQDKFRPGEPVRQRMVNPATASDQDRDPAALHCSAFSDASQASIASEP